MKRRVVAGGLLVCGLFQLLLAAYTVTAFHVYKHPTHFAVERIRSQCIDTLRLRTTEAADLDRQFEIVLSNERSLQRDWSKLWPLAPVSLGLLALPQIAAAIFFLAAHRKEEAAVQASS